MWHALITTWALVAIAFGVVFFVCCLEGPAKPKIWFYGSLVIVFWPLVILYQLVVAVVEWWLEREFWNEG